ncbi:MAG: MBL fold metallo-hydrolase [Sulfobacillus sp.]|nr:MBL fold metallo-hydrolase [Sulfobacillus sp.]
MKKIRDHVYLFTSVMQQLNTVAIRTSHDLIVIDPGFFPDEIQAIRDWSLSQRPTSIRAVLLTHSDFDHVAGAPYFPTYDLLVSSRWDRNNEALSLRALERFDTEFYLDRPWSPEPMAPLTRYQALADGMTYGPLQVFHIPGHTRDSISVVYQNLYVVGDYLSALEFPFINSSSTDYLNSLTRMQHLIAEYAIDLVVSQHGPPARGPDEIARRFALAFTYIEELQNRVAHAMADRLTWQQTLARVDTMTFNGRPITPGLFPAHHRNLKTLWKEYHQHVPLTPS